MKDEIVKEIIEEVNQVGGEINAASRRIGVLINKKLSEVKDDDKKEIMKGVKEADGLKLNPQTVYQSYLMVKKFPDMMEENWKPRENLSVSHYFEISREKFSTGTLSNFIEQASMNSWSVRKMKSEVRNTKDETLSEDEKERKEIFKVIYSLLKLRDNTELIKIAHMLEHHYAKNTPE